MLNNFCVNFQKWQLVPIFFAKLFLVASGLDRDKYGNDSPVTFVNIQ
jgi:hypothetical protein